MARFSQCTICRSLVLGGILVGFGLRVYNLGADSLWNDEAGQALAAMQTGVADVLMYVRSHAAAMPMDYLVTRLFSHLSTSEYALRFPAVFWSTAAIALLAALGRWVAGLRVSTIAVWLMATSPQLVYYGQETRPYAALLAFSLLSTYLLLRAIDGSTAWRWVLWAATTVAGAYFHLYALLTAIFGVTLMVLNGLGAHDAAGKPVGRVSLVFVGSYTAVLLLVMPGYLFFAAQDNYQYPLFQYGGDFWSVTATGLGWPLQRYPVQSTLLLTLTIVGVVVVLVRRWDEHPLMALLIGIPLIICAIFLMDILKGYWYVSRQFVHLQPIVLIFTAIGCIFMAERLAKFLPGSVGRRGSIAYGMTAALILTLVLLRLPDLLDRYAYPKGNGRAITNRLLTLPTTESVIWVQPPYEVDIYEFYATISDPANPAVKTALHPASWDEILSPLSTGSQYLIAPTRDITANELRIRAAGYRPILEPETETGLVRSLWARP